MEQFGYILRTDPDSGSETITCLTCNRTSYSIDDVKHRYCGHCHKFLDNGEAIILEIISDHKDEEFKKLWNDFLIYGIIPNRNKDMSLEENKGQLSELFNPLIMRAMGQLEDEAGQ